MHIPSFLALLGALVLGQETVKDAWIKTAGEDYNLVGKVLDPTGRIKCLGLVSKGKNFQTLTECLHGLGACRNFEVTVSHTKEQLQNGKGTFQRFSAVTSDGSLVSRHVTKYITLVTLQTSGNNFTPLRAANIVDNFDYHVNFVSYRFVDQNLEKRSFKYVDPNICYQSYSQSFGCIPISQFRENMFCVTPTFKGSVDLVPGSPLVARPRNYTDERYVSGLFKSSIPKEQLFFFAKVKNLKEL